MGESPTAPVSPPPDNEDPKNVIEENPGHAIDDPRLQRDLSALKKSLCHLADTMARSKLAKDPSTKLHNYHKTVQGLSNFKYPETRTVGLIGNTGVGKSSVINSILGASSLARSNDDGYACTCVVVEYRAVDDQHTRPYTIEADLMSLDDMRDLLWQLLQSVRVCYFKVERVANPPEDHGKGDETDSVSGYTDTGDAEGANNSDDAVEELDEQEILDYQRANITALQTFDALFKGQDKLTHGFLVRDDSPDSEAQILEVLVQKAAQGLSSRTEWPNIAQHTNTSNSLDECRRYLDLLTTNPKTDQPAMWPFIKLIRVYLDCPILKTGLVLADMPGLHDLNYARQKQTEGYIQRNCHVIGFVTKMSRCHADQAIEEIHWKCDPELPQMIVVTCSDNISTEESSRDDTEDDEHLRSLTNRIQKIKDLIRAKQSLKRKAHGSKRKDISEEISDLSDESAALELECQKSAITHRNQKVIAETAESKTRKKMRVFCVSNTLFNEYNGCDGELEKAYAELSGIPELRQYCRSIPAEAQMESTSNFIKSKVPAELHSVRLWGKLGFDEEKVQKAAEISDVLETLARELHLRLTSPKGLVNRAKMGLKQLIQQKILQTIDDSRDEWEMECVKLFEDWESWPHGSFAAWCRRFGRHSTGFRPHYHWNYELTKPARAKLTPLWEEVMKDLGSLADEFLKEIIESVEKLSEPLRVQNGLPPSYRDDLLGGIGSRQSSIVNHFKQAFEKVTKDAGITKLNMLKVDDNENAYITEYMHPAYVACNSKAVMGKGSDWKRKMIIRLRIKNEDDSDDMTPILKYLLCAQNLLGAVDQHLNDLQRDVCEVVESQVKDLQSVVAKKGQVPEAARDPKVAREVFEKVEEVQRAMDAATSVLLELEKDRR